MSTTIKLTDSTPAFTHMHLGAEVPSSHDDGNTDTFVRVAKIASASVGLPIGCYSDSGRSFYNALEGERLNPHVRKNFRMIAEDLIETGIKDIPLQTNSWCCGINSSARFLAMLGKPLYDYRRYHNDAPRHHLAHEETGPGTQWLLRHMERDTKTQGLNVWSNMSDDWGSQKSAIDRSLSAGRPIMVLLETTGRALHWVTLVGRGHGQDGDYLAVDSNKCFTSINGGEAGLRQRMSLDGHALHKIPMRDDRIACFNSIVADVGPIRAPDGSFDQRTHFEHGLDGNQNELLNALESVGELGMNAVDGVTDLAEAVADGISTGAKAVGNVAETSVNAVGNGIETGAKAVGNAAEASAKAVGSGIETGAKAVGNGVESAAKAVGNFFKGLF